jgi:hypothetical protein
MPNMPKKFNKYFKKFSKHQPVPPNHATPNPAEDFYPRSLFKTKRGRGRPRKYLINIYNDLYIADITIYLQDNSQFTALRYKKIMGLFKKEVFELVKKKNIPQDIRIFNSRFINKLRNQGTDKAFKKSRLVVQVYNNNKKSLVLTQSPTIQRIS